VRTVRDERERLNSLSGTRPAFDYELLATFARNRLGSVVALPFLMCIVAAAAMLWVEPIKVLAWALFVLAAHGLMIALCVRFLKVAPGNAALPRWVHRFVLADLVSGVAWASLFVLLPLSAPGPVGLEVFQVATFLIVLSIITWLASTLPAAASAAAIPLTLVFVATCALRGEMLFYIIATMALAALMLFLFISARHNTATLAMLDYRAQKDLLIAEIATAKSLSDEARRRAEEANLAKSRFLATMSHELRTPLNAILGFSEIMKNEVLGPMGNANYKDYVNDIHNSGQHLLNLINEILDLSRVEAGRYELNEEPISLAVIAEECVHLLQLKAREKNITVSEDYARNLPRLWADERAVRQIVLNLLSNAIKFTPPGGEVAVAVNWATGGGQFVSVQDNGPGIPADEIPIVLSAFGQGSIAIKSAERGAGLGLSIVQALMQTHDGRFELKSKLREGTEVIATFPQSRVMQPLPPIAKDPLPRNSWLRTG
jgi:two-component system cell cycle sensor histidine kinase PleC